MPSAALGAALACCWQPKLDTEAIKFLGSVVLKHHGRAAAWAYRLCVDQPTTTKQGKVTTRYPRGAEAEREHHAEAVAALARTRTQEDPVAVVLRLLVAQRLVEPEGLPNADRQGIYEPELLASSEHRQARPPRRTHLRQEHLAERQATAEDQPAPDEEALDEAA